MESLFELSLRSGMGSSLWGPLLQSPMVPASHVTSKCCARGLLISIKKKLYIYVCTSTSGWSCGQRWWENTYKIQRRWSDDLWETVGLMHFNEWQSCVQCISYLRLTLCTFSNTLSLNHRCHFRLLLPSSPMLMGPFSEWISMLLGMFAFWIRIETFLQFGICFVSSLHYASVPNYFHHLFLIFNFRIKCKGWY